jgi:lipopolysaccharide biosynthesis protein
MPQKTTTATATNPRRKHFAPAASKGRGGGQRAEYDLDDCTAALPALVLVHVGNWGVYKKLERTMQVLREVPHHLVFTLIPACWGCEEEIRQHWASADDKHVLSLNVLKVANKGMDIGGLLYAWQHVQDHADEYAECKTVLKLHTKTDDQWRGQLVQPLLRNRQAMLRMLFCMTHPLHGMYCSRRWMLPADTYEHPPNTPLIDEWMERFGLQRHMGHNRFVAGTIFACKMQVLERLFAERALLDELLEAMPAGRVDDKQEGQLPHAMERVLCYAVTSFGYQYQSTF